MPIIEVSSWEEFKRWAEPLIHKKRHKIILTDMNEVICYPTVTTKRTEIIYLRMDQLIKEEEIEKWWQEKIWRCHRFYFSEENYPVIVKGGGKDDRR